MQATYLGLLTVFAPLLGFLITGLACRQLSDRLAQLITCFGMAVSMAAALIVFKLIALDGTTSIIPLFTWIHVDQFHVNWAIKLDTLSATMMFVVTVVSFLVHVYSIGYMSHDHSVPRFMSYLSLFTFMMLALVTSSNLLQLFFGWEGVGLASYLLIGFWYERESANAAAIKAFLVNRVGDIGLALGICAVFWTFGTVEYEGIFSKLPSIMETGRPIITFVGYQVDQMTLICLLLFIGAMGKSAQLGLHTWLPDAMEGPTPVSALIHAATMVTAGVFLLARLSPLYEVAPFARDVVMVIGAVTAFFAATVALTQNDIKRVIAYSTCSQLGYMFFAAGASAYGAAMFHLTTHAFFKALLFLGAGSVIHAMSDEQNMQKMGGIYRLIPFTYAMMWIGNLALAGIPFFAGYFSKDAILESAYVNASSYGEFAFYSGILVAALTAFYSWRLLFLTFHGTPRADDRVMAHIHESPWSMKLPLFVLAMGALMSGYLGADLFVGEHTTFWNNSIVVISDITEKAHHLPWYIQKLPLVAALSGIFLAFLFYIKETALPQKIAETFKAFYAISYNKWYFDELYDALFVRMSLVLGKIFWKQGDLKTIDRFGPDGMASFSYGVSRITSLLQTGYVYHYAFAMLLGVVGVISWYLFSKGGF
jgi:NADH-quinone oxidoreductase subunit L